MNTSTYKVLLFLHIASVVVAFAPAVLAVVPGGGDGAVAALRRSGRTIYNAALLLAGLFGILLIVASDEVWEFSQTWISLAFVIWFAMVGVFHALVLPVASGKRPARPVGNGVDMGEAILTVLFLVQLAIMIWKPGT
jgi:hypothetical protein